MKGEEKSTKQKEKKERKKEEEKRKERKKIIERNYSLESAKKKGVLNPNIVAPPQSNDTLAPLALNSKPKKDSESVRSLGKSKNKDGGICPNEIGSN